DHEEHEGEGSLSGAARGPLPEDQRHDRAVTFDPPCDHLDAARTWGWEKRGLVVNEPAGSSWAHSHAALPIAVPMADGRVRIYISARDREGRAQIGYCECDLEHPSVVSRLSERPALGLGELGAFDDSGVTSSCIVADGPRCYLFYTGWTRG